MPLLYPPEAAGRHTPGAGVRTHVGGRLRRAIAALLGLLASAAGAQAQPHRYVATPAQSYEVLTGQPMRMPTAVAVADDGRVFVADGARNRVLVFSPGGELLERIEAAGQRLLSRPISVVVDSRGLLWITDTGNRRVVALDSGRSLVHELSPPAAAAQQPPDWTDVAITTDGDAAWLVDNDNDRIVHVDLASGTTRDVGTFGESLGQFHYPYRIAINPSGEVFVTEAMNGRVQTFNSGGQVTGSLGTYGAALGNLYRPNGVALDADGNVWIVDSTLGVVQVFRPNGNLIDVVRDTSGNPLKLDTPSGIALDDAGDMYLTELMPNRVQKFTIRVNPEARPAMVAGRPRIDAAVQPKTCTACHVEWLEPLSRGESTEIMSPPPTSRDLPAVARARTCLSCHDGSLVDSRRSVWLEHGHQTGIEPPPEIQVPERLPLEDGKLVCRTCHTAHSRGGAGESFANAVFLRVEQSPNELCIACHGSMSGGADAGMHPLGPMDRQIPDAIIAAGSRVDPHSRDVSCIVCHSGHGTTTDMLLALDASSNDLCLSCHEQMRPGMFIDESRRHPVFPVLNAEQVAAVHDAGRRIGDDDQLLCLSCHEMHHGPQNRFLLAFSLDDSEICLRCHSEKTQMLQSPHDLRQDFPGAENALGFTPAGAGPCSSCHMFHNYAREPVPTVFDPSGQCATCHSEGRLAAEMMLGPENHPQAQCAECHNPHETRFGKFLREPTPDLCIQCHADMAVMATGAHDIRTQPSAWPDASREADDACLACHRPHGGPDGSLFRAGVAEGQNRPDGACIACHSASAWTTDSERTTLHPREGALLATESELPLVPSSEGGGMQIGCKTCHNPHADPAAAPHMLRVTGEAILGPCLSCHTDLQYIALTGHEENRLEAAGIEADSCRPCHTVHGNPASVESELLWPRELAAAGDAALSGPGTDRYCVSCHRPDGPARIPPIWTHPAVPMFNTTSPDAPTYVPLFDASGHVDPNGTIGCRTCHLPHGRAMPEELLRERREPRTQEEKRAMNPEARTFALPNVCSGCHGIDAFRRQLYFHDPLRRSAPIEDAAGAAGPLPQR